MYTVSWIITFDTVRCCFLLPQKIVKESFWNFLMTPVCFHFECSKKLVLYGAIVWFGSKAFIFCFCLFAVFFLRAGVFQLLRVGVGCRRGRLTLAMALALFLLSSSLLMADSKKRFYGLTADLGRKLIVEKHLVLNRKLGLICSDLN